MTATTLETVYPNLRDMLDDRYADLPDAEFEAAFESAFGENVTPAEYEEFFGGLGRALSSAVKSVGPVVQSALPGMAQGALAGSALGPWGALGGAVIGGVGSALSKQGGTAGQIGKTVGGVVNTAGALTSRAPVAGSAAGVAASGLSALLGQSGAPTVNALRAVLGSDKLAQALSAMFAGRNPQLPVGPAQTPVPASALAGLLGMLAKEAEDEAEVYNTAAPAYLVDQNGQLVVDPSAPEQRAARVLQLLAGEFEDGALDDRDAVGWSDAEDLEWSEFDVEDLEWSEFDVEEDVL